MQIDEVTVDGETGAGFDYDGEQLRVRLPKPLASGTEFEVAVRYRCAPRRGLYFMGPDATHPERPLQCWTQGQDDDSRYYWPCIDTPIEKASTEMICTAPAGNFVLSNGELRERVELPGGKRRPLALRARLPAPAVPGDAGVRAVRRDQGSRAAHRRRRLLLRAARPRGRRAPQLRRARPR